MLKMIKDVFKPDSRTQKSIKCKAQVHSQSSLASWHWKSTSKSLIAEYEGLVYKILFKNVQ